MTDSALAAVQETLPAELSERFQGLVRRVNARDEEAARDLHQLCLANPSLWKHLGSLEANALVTWIHVISPSESARDTLSRAQLSRELDRQREALLQEGDSPLERLLVGRVLLDQLRLLHAEMACSDMLRRGGSFTEAEFHDKRVARAERQLLRSAQALATLRKKRPPMQVNIGGQHINVVG